MRVGECVAKSMRKFWGSLDYVADRRFVVVKVMSLVFELRPQDDYNAYRLTAFKWGKLPIGPGCLSGGGWAVEIRGRSGMGR